MYFFMNFTEFYCLFPFWEVWEWAYRSQYILLNFTEFFRTFSFLGSVRSEHMTSPFTKNIEALLQHILFLELMPWFIAAYIQHKLRVRNCLSHADFYCSFVLACNKNVTLQGLLQLYDTGGMPCGLLKNKPQWLVARLCVACRWLSVSCHLPPKTRQTYC